MSDEQWIMHIKERLHKIDQGEMTINDWLKELLKMQKEERLK